MPLPEQFLAETTRPEFWPAFFFEGDSDRMPPELPRYTLRFPAGPGYALVLDLYERFGGCSLRVEYPGSDRPVQIAWDDQAHWHPHVLRWEELDLVCRCVALDDPALPHPGLPLVLLHRFTPTCEGDRLEVVHPLIAEAYRAAGFSAEAVEEAVHRYDRQQFGFAWRRADPHGWYPYQDEDQADSFGLYSLRVPEDEELSELRGEYTAQFGETAPAAGRNEPFPFGPLNALFEAARKRLAFAVDPRWLTADAAAVARGIAVSGDLSGLPALADALEEAGCDHPAILAGLRAVEFPARGCWLVEMLLGLEPGEVIAQALGRTQRRRRVLYMFDLTVPTRDRREQPAPALEWVFQPLNDALAATGLGSAVCVGTSGSVISGSVTRTDEVMIQVEVRDDLRRGLRVIREVLAGADASPRTTIRLTTPRRRRYPLDPRRRRSVPRDDA